jgi:hypothetical protein
MSLPGRSGSERMALARAKMEIKLPSPNFTFNGNAQQVLACFAVMQYTIEPCHCSRIQRNHLTAVTRRGKLIIVNAVMHFLNHHESLQQIDGYSRE